MCKCIQQQQRKFLKNASRIVTRTHEQGVKFVAWSISKGDVIKKNMPRKQIELRRWKFCEKTYAFKQIQLQNSCARQAEEQSIQKMSRCHQSFEQRKLPFILLEKICCRRNCFKRYLQTLLSNAILCVVLLFDSLRKRLKACQILPEDEFMFLAIDYFSQAQADFQKTQLFVPPSHSPRLRRTKQFHYQVINHKQRNLRDCVMMNPHVV